MEGGELPPEPQPGRQNRNAQAQHHTAQATSADASRDAAVGATHGIVRPPVTTSVKPPEPPKVKPSQPSKPSQHPKPSGAKPPAHHHPE